MRKGVSGDFDTAAVTTGTEADGGGETDSETKKF
jgi:hypothetical protein